MVLVFFWSCGFNEKSEIQHPTPKNLPTKNEQNTHVIDVEKKSEENVNQIEAIQNLENIKLVSQIGRLFGNPDETFGLIEDIKIDSFNRIYILDKTQQHIKVYKPNGDFITTLGNKGQGPREFEKANSMDTYKDSLLYVSNGYRIEVFNISKNEIEFVETKSIKQSVRSLCVVDKKLFIHPIRLTEPDEIINEKDYKSMIYAYSINTFQESFLFGKSYISSNPFLLDRLSTGSLSCNKATSTVMFSFEKFQVLHGYSGENGDLEWQTRIDGLSLVRLTQFSNNGKIGLKNSQPDDIFDMKLKPISYDDRYNIVQIDRRTLDEVGYHIGSKIITLVVDSKSGESFKLDIDLPRILHIKNNLMVTVDEDRVISKVYSLN